MEIGRLFIFLFTIFFVFAKAKRFDTRCKLVREVMKVGIPNDSFLGQWVCLIEKVSDRNTSAFHITPGGVKKYGLYQIPGKWCKEGKKGGDCNIACESLLDEDIRDDTDCAVYIRHKHGFQYWNTWSVRCKNDNGQKWRFTNVLTSVHPDQVQKEVSSVKI